MTEKTTEYRVTITGPEKAREQLLHELKKLEGEADRSGVEVRVQRIERIDEPADIEGFDS